VKQEFFRRTPLFSSLSDEELAQILVIGQVVQFEGEKKIFNEGDPGRSFYLVEEGAVRISRMTPLGEEALAILREGTFFGEMALLDDSPRSADAKAHEAPVRLIEFRIADLKAVMERDHALGSKMLWTMCRTLAARLRDTNERFQSLFLMTSTFK
jgi:CRP-like cAMP-binding protein